MNGDSITLAAASFIPSNETNRLEPLAAGAIADLIVIARAEQRTVSRAREPRGVTS